MTDDERLPGLERFRTYSLGAIDARIKVPEKWYSYYKELQSGEQSVHSYFFSREYHGGNKGYRTGMHITAQPRLGTGTGFLAEAVKEFISMPPELIDGMSDASLVEEPGMTVGRVHYRVDTPRQFSIVSGERRVKIMLDSGMYCHLALGNERTGSLYAVQFKTPVENFEEAKNNWGIGMTMLESLRFNLLK